MSLTNREMARLGELLDEALPLTPEQRCTWLDSLSSEDQPLVRTLRDALLAEEPGAGGPLDRPPRIGTGGVEEEGAAGRHAGERLGAYELLRPLGSGGMADVWLACRTDGAFERQVALKIPRLQSRPLEMTARFALECNILASLEYPGIARLYDAGLDASGVPYIAMEYVQGEPLVAWCDARGLDEAARIQLFLQVLEVVAYAHGRQVIHRDLKPSNIMVTGQGEVRLLDFGLARLLQPEADSALLTRAYGLAVTPEYASPEMLRGESIDSRSDIYSLGVVLHELLTGARPGQPTRPASADTTRLHGALREVVTRALQPDPGDRYPDAASLAAALRPFVDGRAHELSGRWKIRPLWVAGLAALAALGGGVFWQYQRTSDTPASVLQANDRSIAVLPFVNMSSDKDQEYFADGMSEELLNRLSQVSDLRVIARTSSFSLKGQDVEIAEIAKKLNVSHVVDGSVRKSGNRLRITAHLIRADDSTYLWSETYDRPLDDIFAVQDEIAGAIVQALQVRLAGGELDRQKGGTQNFEAHQLYLRAWNGEDWSTESGLNRAGKLLEKAIKLDPGFSIAWSALGAVYREKAAVGSLDPTEAFKEARRLTQHALKLSPESAVAHSTLQSIHLVYDWDWAAAELEGQRALALEPKNPSVLNTAARLSLALGRWDEAEQRLRLGLNSDPLNPYLTVNLGVAYYNTHRPEQAEAMFRKLSEVAPGFSSTPVLLAMTLLAQGKIDTALATVQQAPDPGTRLTLLPIMLQAAGRQQEANDALETQSRDFANMGAYFVAMTYAYRGDPDRAVEWLERAYRQKDPRLISIVGEPLFDKIADHPRYKAFLRRMKLPDL